MSRLCSPERPREEPRHFVATRPMDPEEILELVKEGTIEPDQIEDFEALDPEIQELVADGDLDMGDL